MQTYDHLETLEKLLSISAVSGREEQLAAWISEHLSPFVDDLSTDAMGNIFGFIGKEMVGPNANRLATGRPSVMLSAHIDEIGLVVRSIETSGVLRVQSVGGVDPRILPAQDVVVHGKRRHAGIIGTIPPHLTTTKERSQVAGWDDLFIDLGLPYDEVVAGVRPGDFVSFAPRVQRLSDSRLTGQALDNRAGLAALLAAVPQLSQERNRLDVDICIALTVQEELGLRGAATAPATALPHAALIVDVGFGATSDIPERQTIRLGEGPAVTVGPNIHPGLRSHLLSAIGRRSIPVQVEVSPSSSGTDAWEVQTYATGIPTGLLSIPLRYMHSTAEVVDLADIQSTARAIIGFCEDLDTDTLRRWQGGPVADFAQ